MDKNTKQKNFGKKLFSILIIIVVAFFTFYPPLQSHAALSGISDQMTRSQGTASISSDHDIRFRVATAGLGDSNDTMVIDFDDDFGKETTSFDDVDFFYGSSQSEVNGSCSTSCTNATLAAAQGAATWGVVWDGGTARELTFTFPSSGGTAVAANDYVRILIGDNATGGASNDQMTNPANTNATLITVTTKEDGSTTIDSGSIAIALVADDTVTVNAAVDPSITFVINGGGVVNLGTITTSALSIQNHTIATTTNAVTGYTTRMYENNDLRSTVTPADTINDVSDGTVTINNEEYGMATSDTGVTITTDTGGGTTGEASAITTTAQSVASAGSPVTSDTVTI